MRWKHSSIAIVLSNLCYVVFDCVIFHNRSPQTRQSQLLLMISTSFLMTLRISVAVVYSEFSLKTSWFYLANCWVYWCNLMFLRSAFCMIFILQCSSCISFLTWWTLYFGSFILNSVWDTLMTSSECWILLIVNAITGLKNLKFLFRSNLYNFRQFINWLIPNYIDLFNM